MEKLTKIILIASKVLMDKLKINSPHFCNCLNKNITITNRFYKHISGYSKNRKSKEIIERLSILGLIELIISNGAIFEKRENQYYEKTLFFCNTYKISYKINGIYFIILVGEKNNGDIILLSCFVKHLEEAQKKE